MKYGWLLLVIGLVLGSILGVYIATSVHVLQREAAGMGFINGLGTGFGVTVGLVLMIWLLKTCDRYLAAFSNQKTELKGSNTPDSPSQKGESQ